MDARVLLPGFGICGYRSFFRMTYFRPRSAVTFLAGPNNSGKSNALRFLREFLPALGEKPHAGLPQAPPLLPGARPIGVTNPAPLRVALPLPDDAAELAPVGMDAEFSRNVFQRLLELDSLRVGPDNTPWIVLEYPPDGSDNRLIVSPAQVGASITAWGRSWDNEFEGVLQHVIGSGTVNPSWVMSSVLARLTPRLHRDVQWIEPSTDIDRSTVERLNELLNPEAAKAEASDAAARAIRDFIRAVIAEDDLDVRVPHSLSSINIVTRYRTLALDNLGSGLRQVVRMAIEATAHTNTLVCIEEPETNLHPIMQRRLISYLRENTTNQYIIATHSAHLLNYDESTVIRLTFDPAGGSGANVVRHPKEHGALCADLGYRPADLLQSNAIIWVEGPSDRLYIRRWLELAESGLEEGSITASCSMAAYCSATSPRATPRSMTSSSCDT